MYVRRAHLVVEGRHLPASEVVPVVHAPPLVLRFDGVDRPLPVLALHHHSLQGINTVLD